MGPSNGCRAGRHRGILGPARPGTPHPCRPRGPDRGAGDDIAYNNHDVDDGLRAGLFTVDDVRDVPLVGAILDDATADHPGGGEGRLIHETVRRMIGAMVEDVIDTSRQPGGGQAKGRGGRARAWCAADCFLGDHAGPGRGLEGIPARAACIVITRSTGWPARRAGPCASSSSFSSTSPQCLPEEWWGRCDGARTVTPARVVADYVAGMTDRFAIQEHRNLFDTVLWR